MRPPFELLLNQLRHFVADRSFVCRKSEYWISDQMNSVTVAIYRWVKLNAKGLEFTFCVPQDRKRDGRLFLEDDRQTKFQLSWHENRQKQWQGAKRQVDDRELPHPF